MGGNGWVIVTFKLPYRLLEELDRYALMHEVSRSEVIRAAIRHYLSNNDPPSKPCIRVKRVILT